ncbi:MAG: hypothetical protein R6U32_05705 [Candidatus Woesearchaeota archaeon]
MDIVELYLGNLIDEIKSSGKEKGAVSQSGSLESEVFRVLTSRRYSHVSRGKAGKHFQGIQDAVLKAAKESGPIQFCLDIGGGYHASINRKEGISYDIGLSEVMLIRQIACFSDEIKRFYSPGVQFMLFVDNNCANIVNDIPLENTDGYVGDLRSLIKELDTVDYIEVLPESELFSIDKYPKVDDNVPESVEDKELENVRRFLGRACSRREAAQRAERYKQVTSFSEEIMAPIVEGSVRLTQRYTENTMCFRAFPGADQRIQCGQVGLLVGDSVKPLLFTTKNYGDYTPLWEETGSLPMIENVLIARDYHERKR